MAAAAAADTVAAAAADTVAAAAVDTVAAAAVDTVAAAAVDTVAAAAILAESRPVVPVAEGSRAGVADRRSAAEAAARTPVVAGAGIAAATAHWVDTGRAVHTGVDNQEAGTRARIAAPHWADTPAVGQRDAARAWEANLWGGVSGAAE
jgi:hypothetical protein